MHGAITSSPSYIYIYFIFTMIVVIVKMKLRDKGNMWFDKDYVHNEDLI